MRILMVSTEYAPLAKTGGLGDMVASLSGALCARGHEIKVVMPFYGDVDRTRHDISRVPGVPDVTLRLGRSLRRAGLHRWLDPSGPEVYLLENDAMYGRPGVYGYGSTIDFADTVPRLAMLGAGALALPQLLDWAPRAVHAHDAAASLALVDLACWDVADTPLGGAGSLLTIHNLAHQSVHPREQFAHLDLPDALAWHPGAMEFNGQLNFMKAGILYADRVNTVSPTYAREVVSDPVFGCDLGDVLLGLGDRFTGILNGMDVTAWDPATDPAVAATYDLDDPAGKAVCRDALVGECGLEGDGPLLGSVGRVFHQKGYDLLPAVLDELIDDGWRLVLLGTGDGGICATLHEAARRHPGRFVFHERYDETLARRIYAGSDAFLMPSRFEPCGLAQMYALRYGSVPVVRRTGGLADTVPDAAEPGGLGFVFDAAHPAALHDCLRRALTAWNDRRTWRMLMRRGMAADFGWEGPAAAYEELYGELGVS
ncbi:glycogen synthase [bacterium]|nr:glycogen synthase [bacterium]